MQNAENYANSTISSFSTSQWPGSYFGPMASGVINHPYPPVPSQIPISQRAFEVTIKPQFPFAIALGYLIFFSFLNLKQDGKDRMKGPGWKATILAHNLLLAAYSFWTFVGTGPATIAYFIKGHQTAGLAGLVHAFCDSSMKLWDDVLSHYSYLFYLSKIWEILDTVILIGKGKKASLLQEYHHAGAILTVWAGVRYESPAAWLFVVFNSLVHTIMYTYYALSVLQLPVPAVLKQSLTKIQIAQFIVGGSFGALTLLLTLPKELPKTLGDGFKLEPIQAGHPVARKRLGQGFQENLCLHTPGQRLTVLGGVGYLIPLTLLFLSFYIRAYQQKRRREFKSSESEVEKKPSLLKED